MYKSDNPRNIAAQVDKRVKKACGIPDTFICQGVQYKSRELWYNLIKYSFCHIFPGVGEDVIFIQGGLQQLLHNDWAQ